MRVPFRELQLTNLQEPVDLIYSISSTRTAIVGGGREYDLDSGPCLSILDAVHVLYIGHGYGLRRRLID